MTRVAVGGFLHETNTFAPTKATYDDFVHGGGWPSMTEGAEILKVMRNINVGLAGFIEAAETQGWELVPTIACAASPSAHVTKDAFERVVKAASFQGGESLTHHDVVGGAEVDLAGVVVGRHHEQARPMPVRANSRAKPGTPQRPVLRVHQAFRE